MNIVIFKETAKRIVRAAITTKTIVRKKWNHENTLSKRRKERKATKNRWDKQKGLSVTVNINSNMSLIVNEIILQLDHKVCQMW